MKDVAQIFAITSATFRFVGKNSDRRELNKQENAQRNNIAARLSLYPVLRFICTEGRLTERPDEEWIHIYLTI